MIECFLVLSELVLSPPRPEWLNHSHPKRLPGFNSSSQSAPHAHSSEPLSKTEEPPRTDNPSVMQTAQTPEQPSELFIGGNRFFAGLVLHQVRPCDRSRNQNPGSANAGSMVESDRPLTIAPLSSAGSPPGPIEKLLAELVRRRLRNLAAKKGA